MLQDGFECWHPQLYLSEMQFDHKLYENKKDLPSVPLLTT
jgi:hypothetical protein